MGERLGVDPQKKVLSIVCLGKPAGPAAPVRRKPAAEKIRYMK
jgi:hypothetical protein